MAIVFENPLPYDIRICGSANEGFILSVGCCTCVFTDIDEVTKAIKEYVDDPRGMEEKYNQSVRDARPQIVESGYSQQNVMAGGTALRHTNEVEPSPQCDCDSQPDRRR